GRPPGLPFPTPDELVQQLGTLDTDEVRLAFVRNRLRKQRLPRTRRSIEQQTLRRRSAHSGEDIRIFQRPLNCFPKLLLNVLKPPNVLPLDIRDLNKNL